MKKQRNLSHKIQFLLCWFFTALLQLPLFLALTTNVSLPFTNLSFWVPVFHILSSVIMFFATPKKGGWFSRFRHWGESQLVWTFIFPGFGWLITGLLWLIHDEKAKPRSTALDDDFSDDDDTAVGTYESEWDVAKKVRGEADLVPAVDALLGSDPTIKRGAIQMLAKIKTPEAIANILKARSDENPEVRFYATSTLTNVKRDFEQAIEATENEVFSNPGNLKFQIALYRIQYEYAVTGLVESERRAELLYHAHEGLQKLAHQNNDALELQFHIEKEIHLDKALNSLDLLTQKKPEAAIRWLKERINLQFRLSNYSDVLKSIGALKEAYEKAPEPAANSTEDMEWKTSIMWWQSG